MVISNEDHKMYYVAGMNFWKKGVAGKIVKITGTLQIENQAPPKSGEPPKQQIVGIKRIIQNPKWDMVN